MNKEKNIEGFVVSMEGKGITPPPLRPKRPNGKLAYDPTKKIPKEGKGITPAPSPTKK